MRTQATRSDDPLAAFRRDLSSLTTLDAADQLALARRYARTGDERIAARLVESNQRLVLLIAHQHRAGRIALMDLVQEGNLGLLQAVKRFDHRRGVKLSSYAAWWIRAFILRHLLHNWRIVRLGRTHAERRLFFNLRKELRKLEAEGVTDTTEHVAARLKVTPREVEEMSQRMLCPEVSLDAPVGTSSSDRPATLGDNVTSEGEATPEESCARSEIARVVRARLREFERELEGRDLMLFRERWLREEPLSLREMGQRFGISHERARQIECRLLAKLRKRLGAELASAAAAAA